MIGLCHNDFLDSSIIRKCLFGQSSPNDTNVKNYLPVSSVLTNETYQNRFCAYCNLEQEIKVSQLPDMSRSSTCRHHQKRFVIYIKLSSLTGLAWLFGFIAEISHSDIFLSA
ncbi:uncharacterized protein LOC110457539 [Mizuhopecten yessoensis]|uniref:uncharacterized protein LOC110457539 n=1 Tax=Mizuhopecten yessoensis TaxID=6573 RepID=UPI000B45D7F2|nr:uncharacterized protein LOC110457539 [Mizuhopecten yessoensis]